MERKEVDFKLSVLSDWSLSGFPDLELDDKYDADFLAKVETARKDDKMYLDRKLSHADCSPEFNHIEKEMDLLKPGGGTDEREEVSTEQKRLVYFYGVRQAEFRRLINALDNQRSTETSEENETKDIVKREDESLDEGGFKNEENPLGSSQKREFCSLEKVDETPIPLTETPILPTKKVEVVNNKARGNIFRRVAKWIRGLSCCSISAVINS